jgi:hypothetical protein
MPRLWRGKRTKKICSDGLKLKWRATYLFGHCPLGVAHITDLIIVISHFYIAQN